MSSNISVSTIASMLRADAENLARKLLPGGRYEGAGEYRCSASNSPTGEAISVHVGRGDKQGVVGFWGSSSRSGGDMLDLIQEALGLDKTKAIEWAKSYLGFGHTREWLTSWKKRRGRPVAERRAAAAAEARKQRLSSASGIWKTSGSLGGVSLSYLSGRGISIGALGLEKETSLRAHAGLPHPEGGTFPAIVARVVDREGLLAGVWRIFLKPDGSGKAPVTNPKLGLGECGGCAVRLGGDAAEIGIAEGIETALACRELMVWNPDEEPIPVWAALSAPGLAAFKPPAAVRSVRIFVDNDSPKFNKLGKLQPSAGMEAAEKLKARLEAEEIKVTIVKPPEGMDWLDVLNRSKEK